MPDIYRIVNIVRFTAMRIKQNYYTWNVPEVLQHKDKNKWMEFDIFSLEIVGLYLKRYQKDNKINIFLESQMDFFFFFLRQINPEETEIEYNKVVVNAII
ncbi:hypothetical protein LGFR6_19400 [Lactococcus garvieae]